MKELIKKIYDPQTSEKDLQKLLLILLNDYEESSFQILWYIIRNDSNIYSPRIIESCLTYIGKNRDKQYSLDFYRLKDLDYPLKDEPIILTIKSNKFIKDLVIKNKMLIFDEIMEFLKINKLKYEQVQFINKKSGYDLSHIIHFRLIELKYIKSY